MQKLVAKTEVAFDIVGEEVGGGVATVTTTMARAKATPTF
jgi:hypothetical protein